MCVGLFACPVVNHASRGVALLSRAGAALLSAQSARIRLNICPFAIDASFCRHFQSMAIMAAYRSVGLANSEMTNGSDVIVILRRRALRWGIC